ncbi:permease [Fuerstiella marisgermanici]|uniref:Copper exporting ATPase n=1 Tax=Fuerstiella marisgermanici TaxID=1891926 RepID=A0A1P8WPR6_9PLAN|nr:permease [Fuerstiella marisgermanici]APZ96053.1 copper exporting ATPase [Fuerstiella marisgermanici]
MINALWTIWLELAPWLLLGAIAGGLLHALLPAGWLQKHLSGRMGVLKAVFLGVPLPLCSCGVIPVGLGLRKNGASNGAAVGFLISTPQTGIDSILVSASFLGWPFAILKVAVAFVTGLVGGLTADLVAPSSSIEDAVPSQVAKSSTGRFRAVIDHSLELIESIWGWLVIGVIVSAAITWLVPENSLADIPAMSGVAALLITLVISLPLYVCATASVPIAAALVASGLPTGAALVFLMAGPATNVATLGAVYRALGGRTLAVYLLMIVGGSLVAGVAFNHLINPSVMALHAHDHGATWWRIASAVGLAALIAWFAVRDLRHWLKRRRRPTMPIEDLQTISVAGMTCDGCAAKLARGLEAHQDIQRADVSFADGRAVVWGSASHDTVCDLVEQVGFVPEAKASNDTASAAK